MLVNLFLIMILVSLIIVISGVEIYCEFSILQLSYRFFNSSQNVINKEEKFKKLFPDSRYDKRHDFDQRQARHTDQESEPGTDVGKERFEVFHSIIIHWHQIVPF